MPRLTGPALGASFAAPPRSLRLDCIHQPRSLMRTLVVCCTLGLLGVREAGAQASKGGASSAHVVRPQPVLREQVRGMPTGAVQEVRVFAASFQPGDQTVFHTHRAPVTVYVLEGAFTLEMAGRAPVVVRAGTAFVEPPNVRMTGYNRSATAVTRVLVYYVSNPGEPFLDPIAR